MSRISDHKSQISRKQPSIKSSSSHKNKSNEKIDLMYVPHAPKQPSHKSFKKTDKSIQWSEIDMSIYGKTNNEPSRIQTNFHLQNEMKTLQI